MSVTGVEGEEREDLSAAESRQLRDRSVRLLGSLLRPLRGRVAWTIVVVVISTAAQIAGPALIAFGINVGLPALFKNKDWWPITATVIAYLVAAIVGAW